MDSFLQNVKDYFEQLGVMPLELRVPLSVMMFLQFAIWGAWFVVLGNYLNALNFSRKQIARVYATMPIGAIISPMFIGTIADQYFNAEHVMAVSHLLGGCLLIWLAQIRTPLAFFWVALIYALVYSPTLSLVNSIMFEGANSYPEIAKQIKDQFPTVRVFGTIGWIAAGMSLKLFIKPGQPVNNRPILLAAALSFALGAFSFMLPKTEPGAILAERGHDQRIAQLEEQRGAGKIDQKEFDRQQTLADEQLEATRGIAFVRAIGMFQEPDAAVFFVASLIIAMAMAVYFAFAALYLEQSAKVKPENVGPVMTLGQWVEIFFLFTLTWFIEVWGMNTVLVIGMAAWALRFAIFAARPPFALIALGIALHGVCFDFFFAAGMMNTDRIAPAGISNSAQSLYGVLVYGLGMWLGTEAAGWLNQSFTHETIDPATGQTTRTTNWAKFWIIPCLGVVAALAVFVFYKWM